MAGLIFLKIKKYSELVSILYMRRYLYIGIILAIVVAAGHLAARNLGLYYTFWYTDIILHIISGVMLGCFFLWFTRRTEYSSAALKYFSVVAAATFGSFLWEVWEFGWNRLIPEIMIYAPTLPDSLLDIFTGFAGGVLLCLAIIFS